MSFSSDGKLLATADTHGTVQLWNVATGRPVGSPLSVDSNGTVHGVAFSPDGKLLATADNGGTVKLWNIAAGHPIGHPLSLGANDNVYGMAFSPDGRRLATLDSDSMVRFWNLESLPSSLTKAHGYDLTSILNGDILVNLWPDICWQLSMPVRAAWHDQARYYDP
jgi:WD40 repeat protein